MGDSVQKHKKGKIIRSGERQLILNVFNSLKTENPDISISDISKSVAEHTGVGVASVYRVVKDFKEKGFSSTPSKNRRKSSICERLDDFTKTAIKRKVHELFFRNELPTINKVLKSVNDDNDLPNFSRATFHRILKYLQFRFLTRGRKSCLIEKNEIIVWRHTYLNNIRQFRSEKRKIYYLDETWVNAGHTKNKVWVDVDVQSSKDAFMKGLSTGLKNPSGKGKRLIVVHIGSDTGFLQGGLWVFESKSSGDYHQEMTGNAFQEWFTNILTLIEPGSVIVMDNAPYHSVRQEKIPNQSTRKNEIIQWLESKSVSCDSSMLKIELLMKVKAIKSKYNLFKVDEIAKRCNCTVLRLPPYHCNLNPIELVWAQVKGFVASNNKTFKLSEVRNLLEEGIRMVTPDNWKKCIEHVEGEETKMWELDYASEKLVEQFVINLQDDSSSEFSDTSSAEESLSGVDELP